eukprot:COSAG02_NODE_37944_length_435_cov_0.994048_1_plen_114_part_01
MCVRQITHLRLVSHNNNTDTDTDLLPNPALSQCRPSLSALCHSVSIDLSALSICVRQVTHLRLVSHNNNNNTGTDLLPSPSLSVPALSASPLYQRQPSLSQCRRPVSLSARSMC